MDEEPKGNEAPETGPAPLTEFERAYHLPARESMTREQALDEIAGVNKAGETGEDHPYWSPTSRLGAQAVDRMSALFKIKTPGPRVPSDQISKSLDLRRAGVDEKMLAKIPGKLQDLVDKEEIDKALVPLKAAWGDKYEANFELVQKTVKSFASPEQIDFLTESGLGNDQEFIEAVLKVGSMIQDREAKLNERKVNEGRFGK
jgi:hypothetical protein